MNALLICLILGQPFIAADSKKEAFAGEQFAIQIDGLPKFDPEKSISGLTSSINQYGAYAYRSVTRPGMAPNSRTE